MKLVQKGNDDLETKYPLIASEWDYEKNKPLKPFEFASKSHKKVWWKCKEGHSWETMISSRTQHNRGCPYCSHQRPIVGETDFASACPEKAKEWHPTKNLPHTINEYSYGSGKKSVVDM